MRVLVLQESTKYEMESAKNFGDLVYLFEKGETFSPFQPKSVIEKITEKLDKIGFNPHADSVALTGPLILVTYLMMVLASQYTRINILLFDAKQSKYKLVTAEV